MDTIGMEGRALRRFNLISEQGAACPDVVAVGVVFPDESVALRWSSRVGVGFYGSMADVRAIYGGGQIDFVDNPGPSPW